MATGAPWVELALLVPWPITDAMAHGRLRFNVRLFADKQVFTQ